MSEELWPSWTSALPKHWERKRLKHVCVRYADYGLNEPATSYTSEGVRFLRTSDIDDAGRLQAEGVYLPEDLTAGTELEDGDLLLSRSGTIGRSFRYNSTEHERCSFAGYLIRYRPDTRLDPDFAFYFTKSAPFSSWISDSVVAATIGNVNGQKFANTPLGLPPLDEQKLVVSFLNRETAHIDTLVEKKRRLLELLEEKRLAVITYAVTKGLDSSVQMKDSGIDWLGQIPSHWNVSRFKFACERIIDCKNRTPEKVDGEAFFVVRTTCVRNGKFSTDGGYQTDEDNFIEWTQRGVPRSSDVLFTREAPTGEACLPPPSLDRFCLGQRMMALRHDPTLILPEFLVATVYGPLVRHQVESRSKGSTVGHLRVGEVGDLPCLLPPITEQKLIIEHIAASNARLDSMMAAIQGTISRLQEYRSALITNAVTGKIDVRGEVAKEAAA